MSTSPLPMDSNGQSAGIPAYRDYSSDNRLDRSKQTQKPDETNKSFSASSSTSYKQIPLKKLKPGPITQSDLSSGAGILVLRAENTPNTYKPVSQTRLGQKAFRKSHTSEPLFQGLGVATTAQVPPVSRLSTSGDTEVTNNIHHLRRRRESYEVARKLDRELIASQSRIIEQLSNTNARLEGKTQNIEYQYAGEVTEIAQRIETSLVELLDLQGTLSQASMSKIEELKHGLDNFRQELRDPINGYEEIKKMFREVAEEHEQMLEYRSEKIRLQQDNDLLQDQLSDRTGNYTESLEREKELQFSLVTLGECHANISKALHTLHEQYDQVNTKYIESRFAESAARKRVEGLEELLSSLKMSNARTESLLSENEQAFLCKLQDLGQSNENLRTSLEDAHRELSAFKSGEQEANLQGQAWLLEKENLLQSHETLKRALRSITQSLDEAQARNQLLERQLDEEKHNLEKVRTVGDQTVRQLAERDQSTSIQTQGLNTALESHRKREENLTREIARLNALVSILQEQVQEADEADAEYQILEKALSEKFNTIHQANSALTDRLERKEQDSNEEQEDTIKNLKLKVLELEKSSETIIERYRCGELTDPEKVLVGVVTVGVTMERNRTISNLERQLKSKEKEVEMHKTTIANLRGSQIKQTVGSTVQLESDRDEPEDLAGSNVFNRPTKTISSSALSDRGRLGPNYNLPTLHPAVRLAERPIQNSQDHERVQPHDSSRSTKSKPRSSAPTPIGLESNIAKDATQDFGESRSPQNTASTSQKGVPAQNGSSVVGERDGLEENSDRTRGPSPTRGRAAKRRKV